MIEENRSWLPQLTPLDSHHRMLVNITHGEQANIEKASLKLLFQWTRLVRSLLGSSCPGVLSMTSSMHHFSWNNVIARGNLSIMLWIKDTTLKHFIVLFVTTWMLIRLSLFERGGERGSMDSIADLSPRSLIWLYIIGEIWLKLRFQCWNENSESASNQGNSGIKWKKSNSN